MPNLALQDSISAARAYLDPNEVDCVVYHSPCPDGSGAALCAWLARGDKAVYIRRVYHRDFTDNALTDRNVVVLDASFNVDHLHKLRSIAKKVMILDHHYSAMQSLQHEEGCFFTMENSGAVLSWHYFHGLDKAPPRLIKLIEDRDLWRWSMRDQSEPLYYALRERAPNSDFINFLPYTQNNQLDNLIEYGKTLVAANQKWCFDAAKLAETRYFTLPGSDKTYKIMCREVDGDRLVSELAEYLYTNNEIDFVMLWSKTAESTYKVSFRSMNPEVNLSEITAALGGGGHKQAAGVVLNHSPLDFTRI
jgi:oligoribonuclease NrnB/cAMP/cGMP phosphodiesterase (DHH superfamily)